MTLMIIALLCMNVSMPTLTASNPGEQGNPIVAIQQKLIERVTYYFNEVTTVCRQQVESEAQMSMSEVKSLLACSLERYRETHTAWSAINQELINAVIEISIGSIDQFVPAGVTKVDQRKDQAGFISAAYQRLTAWYRGMGDTINRLATCGMFTKERATSMLNRYNESLDTASVAGKRAMQSLSDSNDLAPDAVRAIMVDALKEMFEPARADMAIWEENLFQARIEFERRFDQETRQLSTVGEEMNNYAPIAQRNMAFLDDAFKALRNQAWTVWADLRPEAEKK